MKHALVFGENGLIGRCVTQSLRELGSQLFVRERIDWKRGDLADVQIRRILEKFFDHVNGENWSIFWLAGKGGFGVSKEQFEFDTYIFERFLRYVTSLRNGEGIVVLASSAGAVYGSKKFEIITEDTYLDPESEYGTNKSKQESLIQRFAKETNCKVFIARIATVYGPGADHVNGYGLINNICQADIRRISIDVFVPLETSRNYIYSVDAGELLVRRASLMLETDEVVSIRNIVSPWSNTVAEILYESSRVFKRKIRSINRIDDRKTLYGERFDIKSTETLDIGTFAFTSLASGIQQTRDSILLDFQNGSQE